MNSINDSDAPWTPDRPPYMHCGKLAKVCQQLGHIPAKEKTRSQMGKGHDLPWIEVDEGIWPSYNLLCPLSGQVRSRCLPSSALVGEMG